MRRVREAADLQRYARTRDPRLREQLVQRYLPLAHYAAAKYARGSEPFDDLLQVASLGLLKAIDRYDPHKCGGAFGSYALPTMSGELRRHFRDRSWAVRPPRDLQEQALKVHGAEVALERELRRAPTIAEIGARTGLDDEAVLEGRAALGARAAASLSAPAGPDHDDALLDRRFGAVDGGYAAAEDRAALAPLLRCLPVRDREIVRLRFEEDLTQAEIGRFVGLSQMHVSRVIRAALERLRAEAGTGRAPEGGAVREVASGSQDAA